MRPLYLLLLCLLLESFSLSAQRQIVMSKTYCDPMGLNDWYGRMMRELPNGDLILAGDFYDPNDEQDLIVMRTDAIGNVLWTYIWEEPYPQRISWTMNNAMQIIGNDIFIVGHTKDPVTGQDPFFIKLGVDGVFKWVRTKADGYGGPENDYARTVRPCADGGFIICGMTFSSISQPAFFNDVYVMKTDANGMELWEKNIGLGSWEDAYAIIPLTPPDEGFLLTSGFNGGSHATKLSPTGEVIGSPLYITNGFTYDIDYIIGGGYMLCGSAGGDAYLVKLDANLNIVWNKQFSEPQGNAAYSLRELPNAPGQWIVTGETNYGNGNPNLLGWNYWVFKVTDPGLTAPTHLDWQEIYGGTGQEWATSLELTNDGGIAMNGLSWSNDGDVGGTAPLGYGRFWVLKIRDCGGTDSDCDGVSDACDVCPGGDDTIDNNNDGLPDCHNLPAFADIIADWKCGNNKVRVAHGNGNGGCNTNCVSYNSAQQHLDHGDYLGPCGDAGCGGRPGKSESDRLYSSYFMPALEVFPNPADEQVYISL